MILQLPGHDIRRAALADVPAIQALFERDPRYFLMNEGAHPRPTEAAELARELPPNRTLDHKHLLVVDDARTGVIEVVEGYPDATTWYLGLIFLAPAARGQGLGGQLLDALAEHIRASGGTTLRLAVAVANIGARRLYNRLGFCPIARRVRTSWNGSEIPVDVLERDVTAAR